jgi:hypothetical protein
LATTGAGVIDRSVLGDTAYRSAARRIAEEMSQLPVVDEMVAALQADLARAMRATFGPDDPIAERVRRPEADLFAANTPNRIRTGDLLRERQAS